MTVHIFTNNMLYARWHLTGEFEVRSLYTLKGHTTETAFTAVEIRFEMQ